MSADQLVDRVWGQLSPPRVRGALYNYLSRLRRVLDVSDDIRIDRPRGTRPAAAGCRAQPQRCGPGPGSARRAADRAVDGGGHVPAGRTPGRPADAGSVPKRPPGRRPGPLPTASAAVGRRARRRPRRRTPAPACPDPRQRPRPGCLRPHHHRTASRAGTATAATGAAALVRRSPTGTRTARRAPGRLPF